MGIAEFLAKYESEVRFGAFGGIFIVVAIFEVLKPFRAQAVSRWIRWPANLGMMALNTMLLRLIFPVTAVGVAILVQEKGWGLFNLISAPWTISVILSVVLLDLIIYLQHVVFHRVGWLWRLHRMHHADTEFDVTLGAKFHPVEMALSMVIKFCSIFILGVPASAVILFEVILNATAMFNHSNISLPERAEKFVRSFLVTPDMHRIHHSVRPRETHSNFGFSLPWWDRMFGTYVAESEDGKTGVKIGLPYFREAIFLRLDQLLALPFLDNKRP